MVLNQQKRLAVDVAAARGFVRRLHRELRLGRREFNVCFVNDRAIRRLNKAYRGTDRPTDVLSFAWSEAGAGNGARPAAEFRDFLGDVVISAQTACRNARAEGHSAREEIAWLILHGVLHLLGYDHEADRGEMTALELSLRARLGIAGSAGRRRRPARQRGGAR